MSGLDSGLTEIKNDFTLDKVAGTIIMCLGTSCEKLGEGGWEHLVDTRQDREDHTSTVHGGRILLVGGSAAPSTSEWVSPDGFETEEGFDITPGRQGHCSVLMQDSNMLVTGGKGTGGLVTSYDLPDGRQEDLPGLKVARAAHACGSYSFDGKQVNFIVNSILF